MKEQFKKETDPDKKAALQKQINEKDKLWGMGGNGRLVVTAITAALGGNVSGNTADLVQNAAFGFIQGKGAHAIKDYVDKYHGGDNSIRAALQGVLGCAGAAATGGDCSSAAVGAAGSVLINKVMGGDPNTMSAQEKQDRENLVNTILSGTVAALGGDAAAANAAAKIEIENNSLVNFAESKRLNELAKGDPDKRLMYEAAACALIKCSSQFKEGSEDYIVYKILEDLGAIPELADLRTELTEQKLIVPYESIIDDGKEYPGGQWVLNLFEYDGLRKITDSATHVDNEYNLTTRIGAGIEFVSGITMAAGGATVCETVIGCTAGSGLIMLGADQAAAALQTMWSGNKHNPAIQELLQQTLGKNSGDLVYVGLNIGGGTVVVVKSVTTGQIVRTANEAELKQISSALKNQGISDTKLVTANTGSSVKSAGKGEATSTTKPNVAEATGNGGKNKPVKEEPTYLPNYQTDLKGHQAAIPKIEGVPGANQPAIKRETPHPTNTDPDKNSVGTLTGERATADPGGAWEINRGLMRENDSADVLVQNGYNVHQKPKVINLSKPTKKAPDYIINGYVFDNYAPQAGTSVKDVHKTIAGKVGTKQAPRIVLNLMDNNISRHELRNYLNQNPIQGLQEIIVIDQNKNVICFYP